MIRLSQCRSTDIKASHISMAALHANPSFTLLATFTSTTNEPLVPTA